MYRTPRVGEKARDVECLQKWQIRTTMVVEQMKRESASSDGAMRKKGPLWYDIDKCGGRESSDSRKW